jgi:hypothetical protein
MLANEREQRVIVLCQALIRQKSDSGHEEPLGPCGAKSIAEVPINTATPAVINAAYHAIGIRFPKLPVRAKDVPQTLTERTASRAAD